MFPNFSDAEVKEMLNKWREENTRDPVRVRDLWAQFALDRLSGDDKWPIIEQVCIAAMDLHDHSLIKVCLTQLDAKFPGSQRVRRLKTMARLELRERFADAVQVYDEMIRADESSNFAYKRKIAILIAMRKIPEAVKELVEYLKKFMNDQEAWLELADLYISDQEYGKAAFCLEEVILLNPHNTLYHEKYAEILYTQGSVESLELGRSYFAQALKLNPRNMRALYGLYLTAANLSTNPKLTAVKKKENLKLATWALSCISNAYKEKEESSQSSSDCMGHKELMTSLESLIANIQISSN